jgi:hypothetical protein
MLLRSDLRPSELPNETLKRRLARLLRPKRPLKKAQTTKR